MPYYDYLVSLGYIIYKAIQNLEKKKNQWKVIKH